MNYSIAFLECISVFGKVSEDSNFLKRFAVSENI